MPNPYASGRSWTLYRGDCLKILPALRPGLVGAVITDPPYSSGGQYRADRNQSTRSKYVNSDAEHDLPEFNGDNRDQRSFLLWCSLWLGACLEASAPGAMACVFSDWRQLPISSDALQAGGWTWRGVSVWDKKTGRPCLGRFQAQTEFVLWGTNGPRPVEGASAPGVYRESSPSIAEREHITQKTVGAVEWLLRPQPPGALVLDPFTGSGTTGVAAIRTGRQFVGCEIDERYAETAARRLEEAEAEVALYADALPIETTAELFAEGGEDDT